MSLFDQQARDGKKKAAQFTVPELCEINLDVNVINLIEEMSRKRQPRKDQLYQDYMQLKQELGRRPTYLDLHLKGASESIQYRQEFNSYFGFLEWANELTDREEEVFTRYVNWLNEVEKTGMTKSYKMVVLQAMLERGPKEWNKPVTPEEVAPFFHRYLMEKEYRKRIDFSDKGSTKLWTYNEKGVGHLIATMPMTKWSCSSKGLISFESNVLNLNFDVAPEDANILFAWTKEICEYRLHVHFERRAK